VACANRLERRFPGCAVPARGYRFGGGDQLWVYYNARESALFAILYHTAANTMGLYLFSMFPDSDLPSLYWLLAAVNWVVAVVVVLVAGPSLVRTPAQSKVATEPAAGA
jgi:hypothetical protein